MMKNIPTIGVSGCLLGHSVRYDGGHKKNRLITDILANHMDVKTVCRDVGIGLGVPRQTIRLQDIDGKTRLVARKDRDQDYTNSMSQYANSVTPQYSELDGFVFTKGSPTCGIFRVPVVVNEGGHRRHDGTWIFAQALMEKFPWIPVEGEGRLNDSDLRQNFLERVYALHRWHAIPNPDQNLAAFIEFHATHKLMLMARNHAEYRYLGRWVAETSSATLKVRRQLYIEHFMLVMRKNVTQGRHVNVLMHIMGYLKNNLSKADKVELLNSFESYRKCHLPLSAILLLLKHHLSKYPIPYLSKQNYLEPFPQEITV